VQSILALIPASSNGWEQGAATGTVSVNYIGSFHITDPGAGWSTGLAAPQRGVANEGDILRRNQACRKID